MHKNREWIDKQQNLERIKESADKKYNLMIDSISGENIIDELERIQYLKKYIKDLCYRLADLENDYTYIVALNKEISLRYAEVMETIPNFKEFNLIMNSLPMLYKDKKEFEERNKLLTKFGTAVKFIEDNQVLQVPPKIDEFIHEEKQKW